jgi:hypothetical protein
MPLPKFSTLLAAALIGSGVAAGADAGTLTYTSYGFSGENVHISDPSLNIDNEYSGAGLITLNGPEQLQTYCVDIAVWLLSSGTYTTGVDPAADENLQGVSSITGDSKITDILALMNNGTNVAAVQLAIWETEYGNSATFTPDDTGLQAVATSYLADVQDGFWTIPAGAALYEVVPAEGQTNQILIYDPIPEPPAAAILGFALALLGGLAGRRRVAEGRT